MDNRQIAKKFKLLGQLMELHGENPFRTKATANIAYKLDKLPFAISADTLEKLGTAPGIGASTAQKVESLLMTGTLAELRDYLDQTPSGVLEMLNIKGLGPKKIRIIWKSLGIESVGELYYACNENRLIEAKGFGLKTQEDIKKAIEFSMSSQGWSLYANVAPIALDLFAKIRKQLPEPQLISFTGDFRRKNEVLQEVCLLVAAPADQLLAIAIGLRGFVADPLTAADGTITLNSDQGIRFKLIPVDTDSFHKQLLLTTGSEAHLRQLAEDSTDIPQLDSEEAIYRALGLAYIEPELREGLDEISLARDNKLPDLITFTDLRGSLHNHSTYSDGVNTLEEMARYCRDELKLQYLGICDHSKTAVYANGLPIERVQAQWEEIDRLNTVLAPFRIFKGIESDILSDGALDYPDEILAGFDFVVASIHSNLKMDEERATARLITAIENPYTTMLGHPTGRLLLSRGGYPIDYKRVIDACAANGVAIEINANPLRLDLDWRWHRYALERGVMLSINPDAHRISGFHDMHYGVYVARKGGLDAKNCLNAMSVDDLSTWLSRKHSSVKLG